MRRVVSCSLTTYRKPRKSTERVPELATLKPVERAKIARKLKHETAPDSVALPTCSSVVASRGSGEDVCCRFAAYWKLD